MSTVSLESFLTELDRLKNDAVAALSAAGDADALEQARVEFLGLKSGRLKAVQKLLGGLSGADRPAGGRHFNDAKEALAAALEAARTRMVRVAEVEPVDVTLPGDPVRVGHLHPITRTIRRVEEIMAQLGFESVDGPEIE
ncbi:MAG: phenylalanine--tRNA ligase subunit alpha, partial [Planctomycetia bacterium]